MLTRHVIYEKDCLICKAGQGLFFVGFGAFNIWRASGIWQHLSAKDKVFNAGAITFIFGVASLNFLYAYRIYMGQKMDLIELRPSYSERFRTSYYLMNMSPEEKREYLAEQLKYEEEKHEVKQRKDLAASK